MEIHYIDRHTKDLLTENPPAQHLLRMLYDNPFGKTFLLPMVKRKWLTEKYAQKMNDPKSIEDIFPFINEYDIAIEEAEKEIDDFTSFNDFFYRKLKPQARPIAQGLVSPGDGKLLAFKDVSDVNKFYIKGRDFTLKEFIGDDNLTEKYKNASMIILRLAPNDYHRYHFPIAGYPSKATQIEGYYYSVSPIALVNNFTKVFCENKREWVEIKSQNHGDMLIVPVGATMVGSIHSTYKEKSYVNKGDEMGYFSFGGSTIVLLFDKNRFKIDNDLLENTDNQLETFVKMGEKIGEFL